MFALEPGFFLYVYIVTRYFLLKQAEHASTKQYHRPKLIAEEADACFGFHSSREPI